MRIRPVIATAVSSLVMVFGPASALAAHRPSSHAGSGGAGSGQSVSPAKACAAESKKHQAGQHGTPFSNCVTAMAKLKSGAVTNPARACATESKKHVAGQHGPPYSQCVSAAAKVEGSGGDAGAGTTGRDAGGAGSTDARGTTTAS